MFIFVYYVCLKLFFLQSSEHSEASWVYVLHQENYLFLQQSARYSYEL